jgi:hypothetical protein
MRKACLLSFATILAGVGLSTTSYAATEPQAGVYVMSGVVTKVTASGGAACVAAGAAIKGYSYFPGAANKGNDFTIVIPPVGAAPSVVYTFPPMNTFSGNAWYSVLSYVLPPATVQKNGNFGLEFTAYNTSSFSIILQTSTISQGVGPAGSTCLTTYSLNFTAGLPTTLF